MDGILVSSPRPTLLPGFKTKTNGPADVIPVGSVGKEKDGKWTGGGIAEGSSAAREELLMGDGVYRDDGRWTRAHLLDRSVSSISLMVVIH